MRSLGRDVGLCKPWSGRGFATTNADGELFRVCPWLVPDRAGSPVGFKIPFACLQLDVVRAIPVQWKFGPGRDLAYEYRIGTDGGNGPDSGVVLDGA